MAITHLPVYKQPSLQFPTPEFSFPKYSRYSDCDHSGVHASYNSSSTITSLFLIIPLGLRRKLRRQTTSRNENNLLCRRQSANSSIEVTERRRVARDTFRAIALSEPESRVETWNLRDRDLLQANPEVLELLAELKGTYYLNGLASCEVGSRLVHPFEAHGFLRSMQFNGDGTLTYRGDYVHTLCETLERTVGRPLFRGVFSNVVDFEFPMGLLNMLSPGQRETANLACRLWPPADASSNLTPLLIAAGDNDVPMALEPQSLAPQGALSFEGLAGKKWLAHTRYDTTTQRLVFASCSFVPAANGLLASKLEFKEYDIHGKCVASTSHTTSFMVMHDWIITEHFYVIPKNPAKLELSGLARYLTGLSQGTAVFTMREDTQSSILLIPRSGDSPVKEVRADRFFNIFHMGPTYELANDRLVMNAVLFDSYEFGCEMGFDVTQQDFDPIRWSAGAKNPAPHLHRFVIDVDHSALISREQLPVLDEHGIDVPVDMSTFHPLRDGKLARYCYFSGAARPEGWFPFRSVVKVDLSTGKAQNWDAGDQCVVSEPLFIPRGKGATEWLGEDKEDDGWLMSVIHNAALGRCELAVLDARRVNEGPKVLLDLGKLSPWGVHGCWAPRVD